MALFSFPEHIPETILACVYARRARDDAVGGAVEDSGRESQVKSSMLCKSLGWLSVISIWHRKF